MPPEAGPSVRGKRTEGLDKLHLLVPLCLPGTGSKLSYTLMLGPAFGWAPGKVGPPDRANRPPSKRQTSSQPLPLRPSLPLPSALGPLPWAHGRARPPRWKIHARRHMQSAARWPASRKHAQNTSAS